KDGSIYLWDLNKPSGHLGYQTLPSRLRTGLFRTTQFTPDSRSILGVESSGGVALWDAHTLKETRRLSGISTNAVISFSPDSRWLVSDERHDKLSVWDVVSGLERTNLNFERIRGPLTPALSPSHGGAGEAPRDREVSNSLARGEGASLKDFKFIDG